MIPAEETPDGLPPADLTAIVADLDDHSFAGGDLPEGDDKRLRERDGDTIDLDLLDLHGDLPFKNSLLDI